jgi:hypothetical protein
LPIEPPVAFIVPLISTPSALKEPSPLICTNLSLVTSPTIIVALDLAVPAFKEIPLEVILSYSMLQPPIFPLSASIDPLINALVAYKVPSYKTLKGASNLFS